MTKRAALNKPCHPELYKANRRGTSLVSLYPSGDSGSIHCGKWNLPWNKMLKQVQHDKCAFTLAEGATHVTSLPTKVKGFTLAEVLITIGIIGVVAAITIPGLMSNYRKNLKTTRLKKFHSTMMQAIRMHNSGDSLLDASMLTEAGNPDQMMEFVKANYSQYIKFTILKKSPYGVIVGFPDGSGAEFVKTYVQANEYIVFCPEYKDCDPSQVEELISNVIADSKNRFQFWVAANTFIPRVNEISEESRDRNFLLENCKNGSMGYCTKLLYMDNWEFKKDYPFKI